MRAFERVSIRQHRKVRAVVRASLAAFVMCLAALVSTAVPALAQRCASDNECRDNGRARTWCSGNSLVTRQTICRGTCQEVEVSRQSCPGACAGDRCVGGATLNSPPALQGGGRVPVGVCARVCSCKGRTLTYGLGFGTRESECARRTVDCKYGCSCDPEPRCLKRGEV